jgi:hypothetical protein
MFQSGTEDDAGKIFLAESQRKLKKYPGLKPKRY